VIYIDDARLTERNKRKTKPTEGHKGHQDKQVVDVGPSNSIFVSFVIFCGKSFLSLFLRLLCLFAAISASSPFTAHWPVTALPLLRA
jgi:hypothetical protein